MALPSCSAPILTSRKIRVRVPSPVWCATARALTDLEARLEIDATAYSLPSYRVEHGNMPWQAAREGYRIAEDERRRLALGEGPIRFVDELLMTSGVRSAKATLPTGILSISIGEPDHGLLVVVEKNLGLEHRRFRYAHGLAHFLFDTEAPWRVCKSGGAPEFPEVRADAFASALLIPQYGLRRYVETLGKETPGRAGPTVLSVFSEGDGRDKTGESRRVDGRQRRGSSSDHVVGRPTDGSLLRHEPQRGCASFEKPPTFDRP